METNRTMSRRALALIHIRASEALLPLSRVVGSLSRLTPISRRHRVVPTERAEKVLRPWGTALRSYGALLGQVYHIRQTVSEYSIAEYRLRARAFHPHALNAGAFKPGEVKRDKSCKISRRSQLMAFWLFNLYKVRKDDYSYTKPKTSQPLLCICS
jgi:hypothetical protein